MTQAPITNRQIEDATIRFILHRKPSAGREAVDTRGQGAMADIEGDCLVEVKAYGQSARGSDLWLEPRQVQAALDNPSRFPLIVVEHLGLAGRG